MAHTLEGYCQSCMMPFRKDLKGENRESAIYCTYCFSNGQLCYLGNNIKEFKQAMIKAITARGESEWKVRLFAFMAGFAPRWKKKK